MSALTWRSTKSFADLGDYSYVDFSWPLLENSVDPEKALLAFVNEHNVFDGDRIVVASSGVLDAVGPYSRINRCGDYKNTVMGRDYEGG